VARCPGRETFEAALREPDALADLIARDQVGPCEFEEIAYVAREIWTSHTGRGDTFMHANPDFPFDGVDGEPAGESWTEEEDVLASRWPRLWARFGDNPLM
jgi:hypothetical protein